MILRACMGTLVGPLVPTEQANRHSRQSVILSIPFLPQRVFLCDAGETQAPKKPEQLCHLYQ